MSQKDIGNKIPIYKLKTTKEVMDFYDDWGDKDKYNKDMVDWIISSYLIENKFNIIYKLSFNPICAESKKIL